jgi:hypothetical protein
LQAKKAAGKKRKRLTAFDISEIIIEKGIKSREELLIFAKDQKDQGKKDIAEFIVNRGSKVVADILNTAWEMEHAKEKKARRAKSRMQLLNEAREGSCVLYISCCESTSHTQVKKKIQIAIPSILQQ